MSDNELLQGWTTVKHTYGDTDVAINHMKNVWLWSKAKEKKLCYYGLINQFEVLLCGT